MEQGEVSRGRLGHSVYISRHAYNPVACHAQVEECSSLAASAVYVLTSIVATGYVAQPITSSVVISYSTVHLPSWTECSVHVLSSAFKCAVMCYLFCTWFLLEMWQT